jgi:hypothetical protein
MGRPSFRRRKFFIKKEFQGKFIALYSLGVVLLAGLTTLGLNTRLHQVIDAQIYTSHVRVQRTGEIFLRPLLEINLYALFAICGLVLVSSLIIFKRLNRHFSRMDKGFRAMAEGDYQGYVPVASHFEEINSLIDMVKNAQQQYGEQHAELMDVGAALQREVEQGASVEQLKPLHQRLSKILQRTILPESI